MPQARTQRPVVLVLGPDLRAVSGVSSHLKCLLGSRVAEELTLVHFQVGSEGRNESSIGYLWRLLVSPLALGSAILARGVAVVHLNTSLNVRAFWRDLVYLIVARICGSRVLYQIHGGSLPQDFVRGSGILAALLRMALRLPDAIVVLAEIELQAYRTLVPWKRVIAVPNGIDCSLHERRARARSDPQTPLRLVYLGRLAKEKGLYELLGALKRAHFLSAKARLTIAGSGPEESPLRLFARDLGLAREVEFIGPVFGEDKTELLSSADVFVLASYSEGLPYALLESMAAGAPVITTAVGAIPDVVVDGVHGFLVPPRNTEAIAGAIVKLASDRDLLARMSAACRARIVGAYSIERLARDFCALYHELTAGKPDLRDSQFDPGSR